ncbi:hypothetical protein GCM10020369_32750 [Cryptosporangium minutisporangium]|uniref:DUF4229 domain-containing protein n=2 Tax=Cryptosporangium minutisporangium TaxID=113569 RepID=A0ABP6SXM6_9ACTN
MARWSATGLLLSAGSGLVIWAVIRAGEEPPPGWVVWAAWIVCGASAIVSLTGLVLTAVFGLIYQQRRPQLEAQIRDAMSEMQERVERGVAGSDR